MVKHCPICNRSSDEIKFYGELCEECYIDTLKRKLPHRAEIETCRVCKRIRVGGHYSGYSGAALAAAIGKFFKGYHIEIRKRSGNIVDAELSTETPQGNVSFDYRFEIDERRTICTTCARRLSGYYEAVVQLRGSRNKFEAFSRSLGNYLTANGSFIAKEEEADGGLNIFTGDKRLTAEFITMNRYKATRSYTLWGMRRGKKVYRNVFAIHLY